MPFPGFNLIGLLSSRWLHYALAALAVWTQVQRADSWRDQYHDMVAQAKVVSKAVSTATGGGNVKWIDVAAEVLALGESNKSLKTEIKDTNARLDDLARQAIAAKAEGAQLRVIADKAVAQRRAAYRRLSDKRAAPAVQRDCETLAREANAALDILREQGF